MSQNFIVLGFLLLLFVLRQGLTGLELTVEPDQT